MLECSICSESKEETEFYSNGSNGKHTHCKSCKRKSAGSYYHRNPDKVRFRNLLKKYGLSASEYAAMLESHAGKCGSCGSESAGGRWNVFNVDHDHETGAPRGLLCLGCNTGAWITDDPDLLAKKILYLLKHGKVLSSDLLSELVKTST